MPWTSLSLKKLEMMNFRRFYGHHEIDLKSDYKCGKNIILIGGDNGSGKTSIHEAVNYSLYVDDELPGIATRPNYFRAVSDRLNRRALDEGQKEYFVAIEILANDGSIDREFKIKRSWDVNITSRKIEDRSIDIFENNRPIDVLETISSPDKEQVVQNFLRKILPPRIAPFFFFDGERIQEFADEDQHERKMVEAIEDILHITVYKLLRSDIRTYVIDHIQKEEIKSNEPDDYYELLKEKERLEGEIEKKKDEIADLMRELENNTIRQKQIEEELRRISSPYSPQREELLKEKNRLNMELENAKNAILDSFQQMPILLAGKLRYELIKEIQKEQHNLTTPERIEQIRNKLDEIKHGVFVESQEIIEPDIRLNEKQLQFYKNKYDYISKSVFEITEEKIRESLLHDIGESTRLSIISRLSEISSIGINLKEALDRREKLSNEQREVELKLQSTSDDPHIDALINESKEVNLRIGAIKQNKMNLEGEIQKREADLAIREGQIQDRLEKRELTSRALKVVKLSQEARKVLDEFIRELAPQKLQMLRDNMDEMYSRLKKPDDPVYQIEVDKDTWQIVMKDEKGRPLERRVFSAGMKEMYALSLLWALAKSSGRQIPIIIDTPVARLDATNRRSLFEKYLPHAGHQVIVLSTDTEIDKEWAKKLSQYVAKQYRLDYDSSNESTVIRSGYFF